MSEAWKAILTDHGPMWFLLIIFVLGMWRMFAWAKPYVAKGAEAHVDLMKAITQNQPKQTIAMEDSARASEASTILLEKHMGEENNEHETIAKSLSGIHDKLDVIRGREISVPK